MLWKKKNLELRLAVHPVPAVPAKPAEVYIRPVLHMVSQQSVHTELVVDKKPFIPLLIISFAAYLVTLRLRTRRPVLYIFH